MTYDLYILHFTLLRKKGDEARTKAYLKQEWWMYSRVVSCYASRDSLYDLNCLLTSSFTINIELIC